MCASFVFSIIAMHPMKKIHSSETLAKVSIDIPRLYAFVVIGHSICVPFPPVNKSPMIGCWIRAT